MTDISENADWSRIDTHFPIGGDLTLQILKGHLLVEELLRQIFEILLPFPDALKGNSGTSFECHQIICLVQSMTKYSSNESWVWSASKRLNSIRNDLSHNLEPKSLDKKVESLIQYVTNDNPSPRAILSKQGMPKEREFEAVILLICGTLSGLKEILLEEKV